MCFQFCDHTGYWKDCLAATYFQTSILGQKATIDKGKINGNGEKENNVLVMV